MINIPDNISQHDNVFDVLKERGFVEQVTDEDAVRDLLNLAPEQALLLQLAVQDQEFPDPVTSARRFNSVCLFTVEFNCPVPG